jgi:AsmA protein
MILHKKKVRFTITGVIALVVLAGILAPLLKIGTFEPQIEAAASTALGMDARIKGRMGIALFPGLDLPLKDVNVRHRELNFIKERFVDVTAAVLDEQGYAVYSEKVHGPLPEPQVEKESVYESIGGSVLNPVKNAWISLQGKAGTVVY